MGDDQMSGLLERSTQMVEVRSDSVELSKSLSGSRILDFRGCCECRRPNPFFSFFFCSSFIPFVKLESRNTNTKSRCEEVVDAEKKAAR